MRCGAGRLMSCTAPAAPTFQIPTAGIIALQGLVSPRAKTDVAEAADQAFFRR